MLICVLKDRIFAFVMQSNVLYGVIRIEKTKLVCAISSKWSFGWKTYFGSIGGPTTVPKWYPTPFPSPARLNKSATRQLFVFIYVLWFVNLSHDVNEYEWIQTCMNKVYDNILSYLVLFGGVINIGPYWFPPHPHPRRQQKSLPGALENKHTFLLISIICVKK